MSSDVKSRAQVTEVFRDEHWDGATIATGDGNVWILGNGVLTRIDPATNERLETRLPHYPSTLEAGGGSVWTAVGYRVHDSITRRDASTLEETGRWPVGDRVVTDMAEDGTTMWALLDDPDRAPESSARLLRIDMSTDQVVSRTPIRFVKRNTCYSSPAVVSQEGIAYVVTWEWVRCGSVRQSISRMLVTRIDGQRTTMASAPYSGVRVVAAFGDLYSSARRAVVRIDGTDLKETRMSLERTPTFFAVDGTGVWFHYYLYGTFHVARFDPGPGSVGFDAFVDGVTMSGDCCSTTVALEPLSRSVWVLEEGGRVSRIDLAE